MKNLNIKEQKNLLDISVKISLIIQIIVGIISIFGIFIKLDKSNLILNRILIIDTIVQIVEFLFYIYLSINLYTLNNNIIASQRYIDWVITTPIMLYATVLFMEYENNRMLGKNTTIDSVNNKYGKEILLILLFNFGMLVFGYLGEINLINKNIGIPLGFVFFGFSFNKIWEVFAQQSNISKNLFYFLIVIWALYGVAAMFSVIPKNIMYNLLDIIAKNFYGLFIFYIILQRYMENNNIKNINELFISIIKLK
jgi:bacteriorhodopsin